MVSASPSAGVASWLLAAPATIFALIRGSVSELIEAPSALGRADAIVVTRRGASVEHARSLADRLERDWPGRVVGIAHLAPGHFTRLDGTTALPPAADLLAVCGVGRPEAFAEAVRRATDRQVELATFSDHHTYEAGDVERIRRRAGGRPIVITEKDAVKLERWGAVLDDTLVLRDQLRWDRGERVLRARLLAALRDAEAA